MSMSNPTEGGKKGFTLIELLIVIGVLGILAGIILVAVDPAKRLQQARDARRFSEVNSLLNAILNYTVDNKGNLPGAGASGTTTPVAGTVYQLGAVSDGNELNCNEVCADAPSTPETTCLDLAANTAFVDEYIAEIAVDPADGVYTTGRTGYYLTRSTNGRIEVGSCNAEIETSIKIKR